MKIKFFKKIFFTTTVIVLVSFTVITALFGFFAGNYMIRQKQKTINENCISVAGAASFMPREELKNENTENLLQAIANAGNSVIFLTDIEGRVISCSCKDYKVNGKCPHSKSAMSPEVMQKALQNNYNETGTMDGAYKELYFTTARSVTDSNGDVVGAVFSSVSNHSVRVFLNAIIRLFFLSALVPIILMFVAEYYVSYRYTRPLKQMADATRKMAEGDFSTQIPVTSNDEIGELSEAFNHMTHALVQLESTRYHFIANVSHELKTPMTTIGGFIDGILDGTIEPAQQRHYLTLVSDEVKRLSRLVQSMLCLSKLESGEMQINCSRFDLGELLCEIVLSQEQRINARNLSVQGLENVNNHPVFADRDLIHQVVYNLVDNAVKFTNVGGSISFEIKQEPESKQTHFSISNTGVGIDEKEIPFVFERFYKSDRSRSVVKDSTGLGLHIAGTIVKIHGGKIAVQSQKNGLTTFSFTLPEKQ